jgi:CubicO group peptidase (beta-lactamase class C family)
VKWIRRITLGIVAMAALVLVVIVVGRWHYHDLLDGPDLAPTPPGISLKADFPPPARWSEAAVAPVLAYADSLASAAVIVLLDGHVVAEWGETNRRISVHSVRKSLVGALYGIAVDRGLVDLDATVGSLGIEEVGRPLTDVEKSATIRDLLEARSGIYHTSVKDDGGSFPAPGTDRPGEAFFYNNWSFNAVGGIFERVTKLSLGEAFNDWIAKPIGMQDFRVEDVVYTKGHESIFPAYRFWMTARDLARFGQLYLDGGRWGDQQIVPQAWVTESLTSYSDVGRGVGYGYLWWIMPDGSYLATGTGGQKIHVYPKERMVIVNQVDTGAGLRRLIWWFWGRRVDNSDIAGLRKRLAAAWPAKTPAEFSPDGQGSRF